MAREAKVGIGTVSRVLNDKPNVSAATREKVLAVARRLNYQPHASAQRLARQQSNSISAIIPFFTNYFFVEVLRGVQDRIDELGYDLILYGLTRKEQIEAYLRRTMQRGRVDGVLFFSMKFPEHYVARFQQLNLPVVLVDTSRPEFDSITVENQRGAYLATSHLLKLQHRRIGMIDASLTSEPARVRLEGYRQALEEHGIPFDENLVRFSRNTKLDGFNREAGYEAMKELLSLGSDRPTAVFVASDVQAIGALQALREEGLRIPEDMALIGFDDIELAEHAGLSTMRQPMYEMGTLAVETLVGRIKNPNAPPRHTRFTPEIVVRETCGAKKNSLAPSEKRSIYNLSLGET
ncbi:MAG: LacI family DNA-binding transcriptional regulator [Bacteroidota bacterium]